MSTTLKFALLFLVAAVLAFAVRMLYSGAESRNKPAEPMVQVGAAVGELPAGLLLRSEDLDWKPFKASQAPKGAIVQGTKLAEDMAGVLLRRDMKDGVLVLERDIIRPNAAGFLAAVLKPGSRAVSVPVNNVSGNAGLIQPGDYVDMILTQESDRDDRDRARSVVSETVVENVRVIAVGSVFLQGGDTDDLKKDSKRSPALTVTIEVLPRAAEAVMVAIRLGTLSMALRSFAVTDRNTDRNEQNESIVAWDIKEKRSAPVWAGDVSRAIVPRAVVQDEPAEPIKDAPRTRVVPREITIFRGSKQSNEDVGATLN